MLTVLDIEVTFQGKWNSDDGDPTVYNPLNKLVSVQYKTTTGEAGCLIFNHKLKTITPDERRELTAKLQDILDRSTLIIGHNLKFDLSWLYECGFKYEGKLYDTMIFAYVKARGLKKPLSLDALAKELNLAPKKDILSIYCGEQGLNVDEVSIDELIEYGMGDIETTWQLFSSQRKEVKEDVLVNSTTPVLKLMNEFLSVLIDVERSGVKINMSALDEVGEDFKKQHAVLESKLKGIIANVMGHTPINLGSPEQMSWVLHSKKVKDKNLWKELFNLGSEERNGVSKKKYVKKYPDREFRQIIRENTDVVYKTIAHQCPKCLGKGYIQLYCKDGTPRKNLNVCHHCSKTGIIYEQTKEVAGFSIPPISSEYASDGGFSSSKEVLDDLLLTGLTGQAKEFVEALKEYNAISTYLSSFVEGIRKATRADGLLHTNFNQCVTATGRLSSTRPNLQNQPRESTFPIRKVFISRFKGGKLLNADFKQLEFRVAAFLAQCKNAMADILADVDVHQQTADALTAAGEPTTRQDAKKSTFRPLYGGTSGTNAQKAYFEYFFEKYDGIFKWHTNLCNQAINQRYIQIPSSRVYSFKNAVRRLNGSVTFHTQIKNYPVQGFATGDILPVTMIEIWKLMKQHKVKSLLVLTVHDSIVADVYPGEEELMIQLFKQGFDRTIPALKERFNVDFNLPLDFDLDCGYNLLNKEKVKF